jgi:IS5 family transposase
MSVIQLGFFDLQDRYEQLSAAGDPLERLNEIVPWNKFRTTLNRLMQKARKSNAGRPPYDYVLMFKILVLQSLYNLSDHQMEYQIRDRLSFMRFLGFGLGSKVPDEKTLWEFRERLSKSGGIDKLFKKFDKYLGEQGYDAKCGTIVDASIVEVPRQRNSREDNAKIKAGERPENWDDKKKSHKDVEARWTKKNNETYYGYKDHISIDTKHKIVREFTVTPASASDGRHLQELLSHKNDDDKVWADNAYRTPDNVKYLAENGYEDRMHFRPGKEGWLTGDKKTMNRRRSKIRKRVEHIFGFMENSMKGMFVRTIGLRRARWKIGMMNLVYNMCRYEQLTRLGVA